MEVRIESRQPLTVACLRQYGPYETCHKTWEKLFIWAGKRGLVQPETITVGLSFDDPETTPPEKIRYEACISVADDFEPDGDIKVRQIEGGEYAVYTHIGSYSKIKESFRRLNKEWIGQSGHRLRSAPCLEIYIDDPEETPPELLRTYLCVPLQPD
ncbi:MAG: GyrI-like domain-containing protein [FCB group bacterium]|nr:GyrI-like domain-containing protein [FCB group bacterium]